MSVRAFAPTSCALPTLTILTANGLLRFKQPVVVRPCTDTLTVISLLDGSQIERDRILSVLGGVRTQRDTKDHDTAVVDFILIDDADLILPVGGVDRDATIRLLTIFVKDGVGSDHVFGNIDISGLAIGLPFRRHVIAVLDRYDKLCVVGICAIAPRRNSEIKTFIKQVVQLASDIGHLGCVSRG